MDGWMDGWLVSRLISDKELIETINELHFNIWGHLIRKTVSGTLFLWITNKQITPNEQDLDLGQGCFLCRW